MRKFFIGFILFYSTFCFGQTIRSIDKNFEGWWATTWWGFRFFPDNKYVRYCSGHFGGPTVTGEYKMAGDTIILLSGFKDTHGTVNEKYLLDKDSFLIDLDLLYDYKYTPVNVDTTLFPESYNSRTRYDILQKPDPDQKIYKSPEEFGKLLNTALKILDSPYIWRFGDSSNANIIRIYNTLLADCNSTYYSADSCAKFHRLFREKKYLKDISIIYDVTDDGIPGIYFPKLQLYLGGTRWYDKYVIR